MPHQEKPMKPSDKIQNEANKKAAAMADGEFSNLGLYPSTYYWVMAILAYLDELAERCLCQPIGDPDTVRVAPYCPKHGAKPVSP
mgnify:CR=1 FL=1